MKGNIHIVSPFDEEQLIKQLGFDEFIKKYLNGELYPTR